MALSVLSLLGILLIIHADFRSLRLTALVALTLPFALIGGVVVTVASGGALSLGSLVGFVTVLGIAARNGIMLVSHYRHLEVEEGKPFGLQSRGCAQLGDGGMFGLSERSARCCWPVGRCRLPHRRTGAQGFGASQAQLDAAGPSQVHDRGTRQVEQRLCPQRLCPLLTPAAQCSNMESSDLPSLTERFTPKATKAFRRETGLT